MRSLVSLGIGVITAILLAACSGDQAAPTAPTTTPSFTSTKISPDKQYQFSFSCINAPNSTLDANAYHSKHPSFLDATAVSLSCDQSTTVGSVYSFDYDIPLRDGSGTLCQTQNNDGVSYTISKTGTFTCASLTSSATLTVAEVSP